MSEIDQTVWHRHRLLNGMQTAWLMLFLLAICALAGQLLFGQVGLWLAAGGGLLALLVEPVAACRLTLRLYRARPIPPTEAPDLWRLVRALAERAGLAAVPALYYVPSRMVNAFALGSRSDSTIALTDGILRTLSPRELAGVLAHEVAHIANGDLRVMNLADSISRLTSFLALLGQLSLLLALPYVLLGSVEINLWGLLLLAVAPHLALLAQMGLSRVREFAADQAAVALTGDPEGLAQALRKIEGVMRSWRTFLQPGWGNPEASWLRTHPATADRIARLMALKPMPAPLSRFDLPAFPYASFSAAALRAPRWHVLGHWR